MLLYFKTKTCIQLEHSNIKLIFITYLSYRLIFYAIGFHRMLDGCQLFLEFTKRRLPYGIQEMIDGFGILRHTFLQYHVGTGIISE